MTAFGARAPAAMTRKSALTGALAFYGAAVAAGEACVVWVGVVPGVALDAVLVLVLVNHYLLAQRGRGNVAASALIALAIVPLVRISSLATAVDAAPMYQYAASGFPLLVAGIAGARLLGRDWFVPKLREPAIALGGVPLGFVAFLIARPEPVVEHAGVARLLLAALILLICTGFAEELVFRGVCQRALSGVLGRSAYVGSTVLFAIAYLGVRPAGYAVFVVLCGLGFGFLVARTRSLVGVAFAHGLLNVGALLVWPTLLG